MIKKGVLIALLILIFGSIYSKDLAFVDMSTQYFVKNAFVSGNGCFIFIIKTKADFEKALSPSMMINKSDIIKPDFEKKLYFLIVYSGNNLYKLEVNKATYNKGVLKIDYKALITEKDMTWEGNFPLLIEIDKVNYKKIKFIENGKIKK